MLLRKIAGFAKQKPLDAFKTFLQHDMGSSIRQEPHKKDRKYSHVQIAEEFKRHEHSRKQQRLEHLKTRKLLLEQKLSIESKLLTSQQSEELSRQVVSLQALMDQQSKELQQVEKKLEETQAEMVLIEGPQKLVVLNKIEYLKHMTQHPSGLILTPNTQQIIENVHYLVNNNLPVNKYKLYQLMPEVFKTEIKQLEISIQRLIQQKKLDPVSDPSSRIRFFVRHSTRFRDPQQDIIDLQAERDEVFTNLEIQIGRLMQPHMSYVRMVDQGITPFRNSEHLITVMLSDTLNLEFTPQQLALQKTIREIVALKQKFEIYNDDVNKKVIKMRYRYIEPPVFVKNHPVLLERYQKLMVKYTNPQEVTSTLNIDSVPDDGGRAYLSEKIKEIVVNKYHPLIEKLWNSGQRDQLISKKKQLQIDFYNDSTRVLEEYQELLADQKEKQEFLKIPKRPRQIASVKNAPITLDELTKSIAINNSNPSKYNLAFFTEFLGLDNEEQTRKLFNSFSYLRVPHQENKSIETIKFEIIKFRTN